MFGGLTKPRPLKTTDRLRPLPINPPGVRTDIGHVARKPGSDYKTRLFLYEQRKRGIAEQDIGKHDNCNAVEILNQEFINRTNNKIGKSIIKSMVDYAQTAREQDLNKKRERLATLLKEEEDYFEHEFINHVKSNLENNAKQREEKLFGLKMERERQNEEFVKQKKIQQYMNKCDEIRPYLRQKLLEDSKACQLQQIEENKRINAQEKEANNLWLKVADRINQQQRQRERDEQLIKRSRDICDNEEIQRKIRENKDARERERKAAIEERERNNKLFGTFVDETFKIKLDKFEKQQKLATALKEQTRRACLTKEMQEEEDAREIRAINEKARREIIEEKQRQKSDLKTIQVETHLYLDHMKQIRKERELEEAEREKIIEKIRQNAERKICETRLAYKEKRAALARSTYSGVQSQIQAKDRQRAIDAEREYRESLQEREIYSYNARLEKDYEVKKRDQAMQYGKQLFNQIDYRQRLQEMERSLEEEERKKVEEEEQKCVNACKEFISKHIDILPLHPNVKIMNRALRNE